MIGQGHQNHGADAEADARRIDQRHASLDYAVALQTVDTAPAWRLGKADPRSDFTDGDRRIRLKQVENAPVYGIGRPHSTRADRVR